MTYYYCHTVEFKWYRFIEYRQRLTELYYVSSLFSHSCFDYIYKYIYKSGFIVIAAVPQINVMMIDKLTVEKFTL